MKGFSPDIFTSRTLLRKYTNNDLKGFTTLMLDEKIQQHMGGIHITTNKDASSLFDKIMEIYQDPPSGRHFEVWAIERDQELIGHFELKETLHTEAGEAEAVYFLNAESWGQGLMTEILSEVKIYADSRGLKMIATINRDNIGTVRVLEKTGIERAGEIEVDGEMIYKVWIGSPSENKQHMDMTVITRQLTKISEAHDLEQLAEEHLLMALENFREEEEREYSVLFGDKQPSKIKTKFFKQSLVFRHAFLEHFYMDTEYRISGRNGMEAGSYRMITDLNGEPVDDYLVFEA
ncbi:MAG: GNAT family N-acetyltransferase [Bacteroidetes bacterium]|nr:GNAT family N-acetyltransferase [Bacteroidota bacterium]